jgi:hypothetical protein
MFWVIFGFKFDIRPLFNLKNYFLKMHYKLIQEGHMCNLVLEKDLDLVTNGSFYCDYTHDQCQRITNLSTHYLAKLITTLLEYLFKNGDWISLDSSNLQVNILRINIF